MPNIEEIYQNSLLPILEEYEPKRKRVMKKLIRYVIFTAILGLTIGLLILIFTNEKNGMIPIALTVFPTIGIYVLFKYLNRGLTENISHECLREILDKLEIPFELASTLEADVKNDLKESQFTQKRIDTFRSSHYLKSKLDEQEYLCYVLAKKRLHRSSSSKKQQKYSTIYSGIFGRIQLENVDDFHLFLRSKDSDVSFEKENSKEQRMNQMIQKVTAMAQKVVMPWNPARVNIKNLDSIETQDQKFDDHFELYSNNQNKAIEIFNENIRESFIATKVRGTRYQKHLANSLNNALLQGGDLPNLRTPYFYLTIRNKYCYWGRIVNKDWLPVKLEQSLIQPEKWQSVILDLDEAQELKKLIKDP